MLHNLVESLAGSLCRENGGKKKVKGTLVLMKKNVLELNDFVASVHDRFQDLFGQKVSLQLVSAVHDDPANGLKGKVGKAYNLEDWATGKPSLTAGESAFEVRFNWEEDVGVPGAFIIRNNHQNEFYLKTH